MDRACGGDRDLSDGRHGGCERGTKLNRTAFATSGQGAQASIGFDGTDAAGGVGKVDAVVGAESHLLGKEGVRLRGWFAFLDTQGFSGGERREPTRLRHGNRAQRNQTAQQSHTFS